MLNWEIKMDIDRPTKREISDLEQMIEKSEESAEMTDEIYGGQGVWLKKDRWKKDNMGMPIAPKKIVDYGKRLLKEH